MSFLEFSVRALVILTAIVYAVGAATGGDPFARTATP
jgi:hypothetical protein